MATPRHFAVDHRADDGHITGAAEGRINHHRLTVLAASTADVVQSAGGWLFDRARAGWDVDVRVADRQDVRPLKILGATTVDTSAQRVRSDVPAGGALAVSASMLCTDPHVRAHVLGLVKGRDAEVLVWADRWPDELGGRVDATEHRLSVAARAFKACALAAVDVSGGVAATETLFDLRAKSFRPLYRV